MYSDRLTLALSVRISTELSIENPEFLQESKFLAKSSLIKLDLIKSSLCLLAK
jgi:hypothetical protein